MQLSSVTSTTRTGVQPNSTWYGKVRVYDEKGILLKRKKSDNWRNRPSKGIYADLDLTVNDPKVVERDPNGYW